jgi:hypothetical protein
MPLDFYFLETQSIFGLLEFPQTTSIDRSGDKVTKPIKQGLSRTNNQTAGRERLKADKRRQRQNYKGKLWKCGSRFSQKMRLSPSQMSCYSFDESRATTKRKHWSRD